MSRTGDFLTEQAKKGNHDDADYYYSAMSWETQETGVLKHIQTLVSRLQTFTEPDYSDTGRAELEITIRTIGLELNEIIGVIDKEKDRLIKRDADVNHGVVCPDCQDNLVRRCPVCWDKLDADMECLNEG